MSDGRPLPQDGDILVTGFAKRRIVDTITKQSDKGFKKYGKFLATFNGRDSVGDIWDEVADTSQYLTALCLEYIRMHEMLNNLYYDVDDARDYIENKYTENEVDFIKKELPNEFYHNKTNT